MLLRPSLIFYKLNLKSGETRGILGTWVVRCRPSMRYRRGVTADWRPPDSCPPRSTAVGNSFHVGRAETSPSDIRDSNARPRMMSWHHRSNSNSNCYVIKIVTALPKTPFSYERAPLNNYSVFVLNASSFS